MRINYPINYKLTGFVLTLMMTIPVQLQLVKFALICFCIFYAVKKDFIYKSATLTKWTFLYLICNFIPFLLGALYNNPGYLYYVNTYFLWPILYMLLFETIELDFYPLFHRFLKICTWVVLSIGFFAFIYFNLIDFTAEYFIGVKSVHVFNLGAPFVGITDGCVNSIIFLYSYFISYSLLNKERNTLLFALCFIFVFITMRRIIYVELILAIILFIWYLHISNIRYNKRFFVRFGIIIVFAMALSACVFDYFGYFEIKDIMSFFEEKTDEADSFRIDQYHALIKGWLESPILGNGTGVNASVVRSEHPGYYELTYIACLFERGLLGFLLYMGLLLFLNTKSVMILKKYSKSRQFLLPLIIAVDMMLVANATNNYIQAFDFIWVLFIIFPFFNTKFYEKGLRSSPSVQ